MTRTFLVLATALMAALPFIGGTDEKTVKGTISKIEQTTCPECKCIELTAVLRVAGTDRKMQVRLGPRSFFAERDFHLSTGDTVEITGIVFEEKGSTILLANEVRRAGDKILLRGKYGRPQWLLEHGHTCPKCAI